MCLSTPICTKLGIMYRTESTAMLLDCDELDVVTQFNADLGDWPSGYESDSESKNSKYENEVPEPHDSKDGDFKEIMRFQNTQILYSDLWYILSMPELCDVIFIVEEEKIYGLKAILATRSVEFYNLIVQSQRKAEMTGPKRKKKKASGQTSAARNHTVIQIANYNAEDFRKIIQFIHCGTVDISYKDIVGLYLGASQFGLTDLKDACWDYIKRSLESSSVTRLITRTEKYWRHKSFRRLMEKIADNTISLSVKDMNFD